LRNPSDFKILTVDDDEAVRSTIGMLLECEGFQTVHAKNGRVAIDYLKATTDKALPDLILLDYMMPVMGGDDFCHHISNDKRLSNIPVVMMTVGGNLVKLMGVEGRKVDGYLSKPMDLYSLLSIIEYLLRPHGIVHGGVAPAGLAH
jgi:CheY-like chemotaxis protein